MGQTTPCSALPVQLFVGLGNPGTQYANTRHNAGHWFIEACAKQLGVVLSYERKLKAHIAQARIGSKPCRLLIPDDYMNCCGSIIQKVAQFYRIPTQAICIAHDELDLPVGTVRLKYGGGHGGHNGLRDALQHLSTADFQRIRIGISHPGDKHQVTDFVLKAPSKADAAQITAAIEQALTVIDDLAEGKLEKAMRLLHQPKTSI